MDMGLVIGRDWAMCYGMEHGALRWAPEWVKHSICHVWNWTVCHICGHDSFGAEGYKNHFVPGRPKCVNCGATMKIDGRYQTQAEIDAHDDICYAKFAEDFPELPPEDPS